MGKPLIILGAGGFAREAFCWVLDTRRYEVFGFYDEIGEENQVFDRPVLRTLDNLPPVQFEFLPAVGDPALRQRLYELAASKAIQPCEPIIHPTAVVGKRVSIGPGSILCPNTVVTTNVRIGRGFQMNLTSTVGHDAEVGDFVTLSPGAKVSGNVVLRDRVYIGTNASIREKIHIAQDALVGMGAAVVKNVGEGIIVGGVPARQIG